MKDSKVALGLVVVMCVLGGNAPVAHSQEKAASGGVQVHMVIADEAVRDNAAVATLKPNNIQVKQGKDVLKVDHLIPAAMKMLRSSSLSSSMIHATAASETTSMTFATSLMVSQQRPQSASATCRTQTSK